LGIKSTGDRSLIPMLRTLGFIDTANRPTAAYGALKNSARRKFAYKNVGKLFDGIYSAKQPASFTHEFLAVGHGRRESFGARGVLSPLRARAADRACGHHPAGALLGRRPSARLPDPVL
jgi:hypothetical protein